MTFGQRIKEQRQALGITQRGLGQATQMTEKHISSIEQNKRIPSLPLLVKLAQKLEVSLDYLVLGKENPTDLIVAIKADANLDDEMKKTLISLVAIIKNLKNQISSAQADKNTDQRSNLKGH
jgi:transcriptional regulator with XRE-family HTH domain